MKDATQIEFNKPKPELTRITRMLQRLQSWLQSQRGRMPTYAEMAEWTGVAEGTIRDWLNDKGHPTAEFLLQLLERTPEVVRNDVLHEFCRVWPTINHSYFSGDLTIVSRLKTLLGQTCGFTFIQGQNDERRTFLITALAHSYLTLTRPPRRVIGLDVHAPDWFVAVPGVRYLGNAFRHEELRREVIQSWPQPRNGESSLLLLNGIWSAIPEVAEKVSALASRCHVLIADESVTQREQLATQLRIPGNLITVSSAQPERRGIAVEIRAV